VVVFILNTASPWIIPERSTAPQHTRFILPPFHPTKSSLRCVGGIFLLRELHIENFMSRPDVIPTFCQRRCKTGVGTSFGANGDQHTRAAEPSTYFCVLTIRKQLPRNGFERSGRGQEPSRGHKFSILENVVLHRDFTSAMRLHFRSDLVGVALVGATPLHLLSQTALPLKSPTGAFIAALRFANAVPPQTLLIIRALRHEWNGVSCFT
jgi:hypothetical protein